jgi:DNA invertase Pin-like site-specific DNA recombinase
MAKKVALYCRVSSGNQSTGLEAQVRALRDYCTRNNVTDYILYEDENQSGVKQSRPALDRMMKDVREGMIEKVIVYSFSRYARSVTHLLRALEEFKKMDVGFVSTTECIDTNTPLGSAIFAILGAVAKMRDSDLIRKLLASKMTYRDIARIGNCSTGAVSAEVRALKAEAIINEKNKALEQARLPKLEVKRSWSETDTIIVENNYQGHDFSFVGQGLNLELER